MSTNYDVIIVGNGIIALSTAFSLVSHSPGIRVAVIGPESRLNGATPAAGAMLGCYGEVTEATLKSQAATVKLEMAIKSASLWPEWMEKINAYLPKEEKLAIHAGTFVILNSQAGKRETRNFNAIIAALDQYKGRYERVFPDDIPGLDPIDTHRPLQSLFLPDEGYVNPAKILQAFNKAGRENKLFDSLDTVVTHITAHHHIHTVTTQDGNVYQTGNVLLAAGAYTQQLINQIPHLAKQLPPILAGVGCSLILKHKETKLKNVVRTPNRAGACGAHYLPYDNAFQQVYLGASNSVRIEPQIHAKLADASYLMHWGMQQFDQSLFKAEIIKLNTGNRPVPLDTFPLIGETPVKGLWIVSGTFRDGVHDSPLLADFISRQMLFNETLFEHPFKPARQPIQTMSREEAIEEVVSHYMSAGYEHGMELPKIGWEFRIYHMMKKWIAELYDDLDTCCGISPEILMMLNQTKEAIPVVRDYFRNDEKARSPREVLTA